jgi:hypothetical protein
VRYLLAIWMVFGLVPGLGEVVETAVHLATSGHLAHTDADHGDLGDEGDEHGCGTTCHNCGCCASQALASDRKLEVPGTVAAPARLTPSAALVSLHEPTPPFRPPIAS